MTLSPRTASFLATAALLPVVGLATLAAADAEPKPVAADAAEPPIIPIGYDAFTQWDRWPYLRVGVRASMKSTFDRTGGNFNADAAHFLRQLDDGRNVALDEAGPGILWFVRHNHWHGSPWHYHVDGRETVVTESSTADPTKPVADSVFLPERLFPPGLTWTWSTTKGADLSWVPIPFETHLRLDYGRARYGTGYFILWKVMPGLANLSQPLRGWTEQDVPPAEVLELLSRSGSDVAPHGDGVTTHEGVLSLGPFETRTVLRTTDAPAMVRRLAFRVSDRHANALAKARLRIWWDDRPHPSVDAPLGLFFGTGSLMRTPGEDHIVKSFPMTVRRTDEETLFATYFPMPFHRSARIELANPSGETIENVSWEVRHVPYTDPPNWVGLFHATYRDFPHPEPGRELVLLDTRETEDGGDWCGHFVGTTYVFTKTGTLGTLEGDPRFFFDDSLSPQGQGTGSEEWGGGGDYWGGRTMSLPFAGHPVGKPSGEITTPEEAIHSAYRFLLTDLMPFGRNARITLEHGGENLSREHYETVTYWYGVDRPGLVVTDEFDVGDPGDEALHEYVSPDASDVLSLTSRHELGVDRIPIRGGRGTAEVCPPVGDSGRLTQTFSEFTLKLAKGNLGVLLRRRLDLAYPNQQARVLVADEAGNWQEAGTWYTAGSNSSVFGDPNARPDEEQTVHLELAPPVQIVRTSNRRWREDEFLVPRRLTEGRETIRIRVEHRPVGARLHPGHPPAEEAWTEYRYWAYCFLMPRTQAPYDWVEAHDPVLRPLLAESRGEARSWETPEDFRSVDPGDVVLDAGEARTSGTIRIVEDRYASTGEALRVEGPSHPAPTAKPDGFADFQFEAPAGRYAVWLRGKADGGIQSDAAWLQFDDEVGTDRGLVEYGFGNWRDRYPPGAYAWSSRLPDAEPVIVELARPGVHRLRITARQTPFLIDQIWLSRKQLTTPEFVVPVSVSSEERQR